jgi:hypothetical protein
MIHKEYLNIKKEMSGNSFAQEGHGEIEAAHEIADAIRFEFNYTWPDIQRYLKQLPQSWSDVGCILDFKFLEERFCTIDH